MPPEPGSLKEMFLAALATAPTERAAWLERECAQDAERRQHVERMLAAHDTPLSLLDRLAPEAHPPEGAIGTLASEETELALRREHEAPGTLLADRYKLMEVIGEGGMGTVWLAQQTEPVKRQVAVKLLKPGMDSRQVLARFEAERQALALMDHPHVATVLDAGTAPNGRPFFVMELIEGLPITRYCDGQRLTLRQRLELFVPVCQAIQHAHQKGIIHRDIKPSNVLVALCDGKPVPKVIDFGVAKATGQQLTEQPLDTGFGAVVGTVEYMSPEQASFNQLDVDTRSDVYSLGVLLYELLAGSPPFSRKELAQPELLEMLTVIREQEPPKPSAKLSTSVGLPALAANRRTEPKRLAALVRGELDWIVMKCLDKDRSRRYETANGLAQDLQRHLRDEPVQACPPSVGYRLRKFARRNKGTLLAVSLVVLMLVGGIIGTTMGMWRANAESERATGAERKAKHGLFDARLAQARASRTSRKPGRRHDGWQALTEAVQLARELELGSEHLLDLRTEAIACLALSDLQRLHEWPGNPPGTIEHPGFDADLKHYARCDSKGNISVCRVSDDQEIARLPRQGPGAISLSHADPLSFSPDGSLLAVHYAHSLPKRPTTFLLWDWRRNTTVSQPDVMLHCPAVFSPDGRLLALAHWDGTVIVSATATGKEASRLKTSAEPMHLAFSPEGTRLAVACGRGIVQVWEVVTGKILYKVPLPHPWHVAWHPRGDLLAAACADKNVHLRDGATGRPHLILQGHKADAVGANFAADGDILVSTSWDGSVRLWDPWTGRELLQISGDAHHVSRDGRRVASRDGHTLTVWEVNSGREYRTLPRVLAGTPRYGGCGGFSQDGRWLAVGTGDGVRLWDLTTGKASAVLPGLTGHDAQFHHSGKELFTAGAAGLYRWPFQLQGDTLRIGPASKLPVPGPVGQISLDGRGRILAALDGRNNGTCWLLDLEDSANTLRQCRHDFAASVATSADGRWVAAGTGNGHGVRIWDTVDARRVWHLVPEERPTHVAFSPNGRWLVIGTRGEFSIWDAGSWQRVRGLQGEHGSTTATATFSPDSTVLAVPISRSVVQLFETSTWKPLARLQAPDTEHMFVRGFSPDGSQLLVTTPGDVRLWDLRLIRTRLQEIGLDWPQRPYPPPRTTETRLRVEVDPGTLGDKPKE